MIVREDFCDGVLRWHLDVAEDELGARAALARRSVSFEMPAKWSPDDTHPDLHAAAVILTLRPFLSGQLTVPRGVSRHFAQIASDEFKLEVGPIADDLSPRVVEDGRTGLAFSGGVDSCAALLLLPPDTCCVYVDRVANEDERRPSKYRPDAARAAVDAVEERGWETALVRSDLEYLGEKIGFPVFDASSVESSGAPTILLGDHLGLDSLAWGTVAEVTYGVGFQGFTDHLLNVEHTRWRLLLGAAGIDVILPLAGVSEVGSQILVAGSSLAGIAQSCVRGDVGQPCMNCTKCVRKTLVASAVAANWPSVGEIERLLLVAEFRRQLRKSPIPLTDVYRYALSRHSGTGGPLLELLKLRLGVRDVSASYLARWYSPAAAAWPLAKRGELVRQLDERLGRMSQEEELRFESWQPLLRERTAEVETFGASLADYVDALAGDRRMIGSGLVPLERPYLEISRPDVRAEEEVRELRRRMRELKSREAPAPDPREPSRLRRVRHRLARRPR